MERDVEREGKGGKGKGRERERGNRKRCIECKITHEKLAEHRRQSRLLTVEEVICEHKVYASGMVRLDKVARKICEDFCKD